MEIGFWHAIPYNKLATRENEKNDGIKHILTRIGKLRRASAKLDTQKSKDIFCGTEARCNHAGHPLCFLNCIMRLV